MDNFFIVDTVCAYVYPLTINSADMSYVVVVELQDSEVLERRHPLHHFDGVIAEVQFLKVSVVREITHVDDAGKHRDKKESFWFVCYWSFDDEGSTIASSDKGIFVREGRGWKQVHGWESIPARWYVSEYNSTSRGLLGFTRSATCVR